jgi:hypothetical protein
MGRLVEQQQDFFECCCSSRQIILPQTEDGDDGTTELYTKVPFDLPMKKAKKHHPYNPIKGKKKRLVKQTNAHNTLHGEPRCLSEKPPVDPPLWVDGILHRKRTHVFAYVLGVCGLSHNDLEPYAIHLSYHFLNSASIKCFFVKNCLLKLVKLS